MYTFSHPTADTTIPNLASERCLEYLRQQDDPMSWEVPRMFNHCAELRRFERLMSELEVRLGRRLEYTMRSSAGEGTFHGELRLDGATVRFSNFGRMMAIVEPGNLGAATRSELIDAAEAQGYVVVPEALLEAPCSRHDARLEQRVTWGRRFFGV